MNETHTYNWLNTCRVCLEKSSKLYPLEGPILNVDVYISTMISYCTSIEVLLDEDLPKGVCVPCFKTLRIAYNFIKQFKETNERLIVKRETTNIKCVEDLQEDYDTTEDMLELKEELLEEEQSNESMINEPPSYQDYFDPEEKIIITYVNDNSSSDQETTFAEVLSKNNDEKFGEDDSNIVKDKEDSDDLSTQNILLNRHACPVCLKIFHDFKRGLVKHLYHCHYDTKSLIKCNKCSLGVELSVEHFIQHYTKSHLYQCRICNRKLGSKSSFYYHSKAHTDGTCYRCPQKSCKKSFETQVSLRKHVQTHSDDAKYVCSKCGKKFNTYDTFRYHNKTHDGKRNHLCNVCGRAFLQAVHLSYHMWHHTGVKQFHCSDCDKSYTSVTQLKKHRQKYCGLIKAKGDLSVQ